jgi:hypothetical protein
MYLSTYDPDPEQKTHVILLSAHIFTRLVEHRNEGKRDREREGERERWLEG